MALKGRNNLEEYRRKERERQQVARGKIRSMINGIKEDAGCRDCGEKHPACLQFHHKDPTTKLFRINIAVAQKKPLRLIMEEIQKCEILCANCHAKLHWNERNEAG